jgi:polysaccharide chain length determinant protein (PEP-CTERM system associated)
MEQTKTIKLEDVIKIIKRRRWALIVPLLSVVMLAVIVLIVWDPVYRSTSTILIEEQEISRDYVMATVTSYAEQRLQMINQRIMSSSRLVEIINKFNLYADKRNSLTTEEIVDNMRKKDIKFDTVMADVIDRRTGQKTAATIAFTVSYEGKNPAVVQQVDNVLASLYLEENIKVTSQQSSGTTKFLEDELNSVQSKLLSLEKAIAVYKEKNPRALPELFQYNLQTLDANNRTYDQLIDQLRTLKEKESYMQTQLASMVPDTENQNKDRLKDLRITLSGLKTRYSDEYPDVIRTKKEIAELEQKLSSSDRKEAISKKPDNPAYIALDSELASIQSEISSVKRQINELDNKKKEYSERIEMSPKVEEGYKTLLVDRNNAQAKYEDLTKKYMEAKVAQGLEKGNIGERFTLIDPARLPEKPVRPNRPVVLLIGLILGMGAGIGTVALKEVNDRSARRAEDLAAVFTLPVLAEIPDIVTLEDTLREKKRLKIVAVSACLILVLLVLAFHFFVMDLDVLWARAARRLAQ